MTKGKRRCIPFCNDQMMEYIGYELTDEEIELCYEQGVYQRLTGNEWTDRYEWRPNIPFETTLYYDGFARGCSSAKFVFKDDSGRQFWMFMTDMDKIILAGIPPLKLVGTFEYVKRGQNYGVKLIEQRRV